MTQISQRKWWIGTLYNLFPPRDEQWCTYAGPSTDGCRNMFKACRWSHEICPATGRDHVQIFIELKVASRFQACTEALGLEPNNVHWDSCKSLKHASNCWDYCGEEKKPKGDGKDADRHGCASQSYGEKPSYVGRGGGPRFSDARDFILAGKRERELLNPENESVFETVLKHPAGFKYLRGIAERPRNTPDEWRRRKVLCLWGPAGMEKCVRIRLLYVWYRVEGYTRPREVMSMWCMAYYQYLPWVCT